MLEKLKKYQSKVDRSIARFCKELSSSVLDQAIVHSLNGGKRIRPVLTLMMADACYGTFDLSRIALAVELAHTSSIVVDDMKCMDNSPYRRGVDSVHIKYGQDVAILASLKMIAFSFEFLTEEALKFRSESGYDVLDKVVRQFSNSIALASEGQYLDLRSDTLDENIFLHMAKLKTAEAFSTALIAGWLFSGSNVMSVEDVRFLGENLGVAFQILDDFKDINSGEESNILNVFGLERSCHIFEDSLEKFNQRLRTLSIHKSDLSIISEIIMHHYNLIKDRISL